MKRIETIEDVRDAMQMNPYFYGYVMQINEDDRDYFTEENRIDREGYVKETKQKLAEILDESDDLGDMLIRLKDVAEYVDDALCETNWIPSFEESIECSFGSRGDLDNIIIDDGKVYRLYECYAEHDDKTFIMREEFYPSIDEWDFDRDGDWEMPNQELMGWYCGCPTEESTDEFYGKC